LRLAKSRLPMGIVTLSSNHKQHNRHTLCSISKSKKMEMMRVTSTLAAIDEEVEQTEEFNIIHT